jgi:hypothetical protein
MLFAVYMKAGAMNAALKSRVRANRKHGSVGVVIAKKLKTLTQEYML